jgi:hypothetical protein
MDAAYATRIPRLGHLGPGRVRVSFKPFAGLPQIIIVAPYGHPEATLKLPSGYLVAKR